MPSEKQNNKASGDNFINIITQTSETGKTSIFFFPCLVQGADHYSHCWLAYQFWKYSLLALSGILVSSCDLLAAERGGHKIQEPEARALESK